MVSEILRLTADERRELTQQIVEFSAGRGAVFAAVGAESGKQALEYAVHAEQAGCDAVMAAPPLNSRLSAAAHLDYYRTLADVPAEVLFKAKQFGYSDAQLANLYLGKLTAEATRRFGRAGHFRAHDATVRRDERVELQRCAEVLGVGRGASKRIATKDAAKVALEGSAFGELISAAKKP